MNSRQTLLHYSITPLLLLALAWIVFAQQSCAAEAKIWEEFSGEKALAHVQRLVDLGPHPAGSEAIEKARDYIEAQLRHSGWQVTRQAFTDDTPRGKIHFVNLIARFSGDAECGIPILLVVLALRHEIIRHHPLCRSERRRLKHGSAVRVSPRARAAPESCQKS